MRRTISAEQRSGCSDSEAKKSPSSETPFAQVPAETTRKLGHTFMEEAPSPFSSFSSFSFAFHFPSVSSPTASFTSPSSSFPLLSSADFTSSSTTPSSSPLHLSSASLSNTTSPASSFSSFSSSSSSSISSIAQDPRLYIADLLKNYGVSSIKALSVGAGLHFEAPAKKTSGRTSPLDIVAQILADDEEEHESSAEIPRGLFLEKENYRRDSRKRNREEEEIPGSTDDIERRSEQTSNAKRRGTDEDSTGNPVPVTEPGLSSFSSDLLETSASEKQDSSLEQEKKPDPLEKSPWTLDAHLSVSSTGRRYIDMFAQLTTFSVHPAVLDQHNIEWFFGDRGGAGSEPSALEFNLTMAVCLGARGCNDKNTEAEYWHKAIDQADALIGNNDFYVATALMMMGGYCCLESGMREQGKYFANLGAAICENLGFQNTSVYVRLLTQLHLASTAPSSGEGGSWLKEFQEKLLIARGLPHHLHSPTARTQEEEALPITTDAGNERFIDVEIDAVYQTITVDCMLSFSRCLSAPQLLPQSFWETEHRQLLLMKGRWEQVKHLFKQSQQLVVDLILSSLTTLLHLSLGSFEAATQEAFRFLDLTDVPLFNYLHLSPSLAVPLLKIFAILPHIRAHTEKLKNAFRLT